MKLTNKNLFYLAAFALVAYLIYRQYQKSVKSEDKEKEGAVINGTPATSTINGKTVTASAWGTYDPNINMDLNLMKGMNNASVKYAQQLFNKYLPYGGVSKLDTDGKFGQQTENAMAALYGTRQATLRYLINNTKLIV